MLKPISGIIAFAALCLFSASALAEIKSKEVDYKSGDVVMKGYIAWDDSIKGKRPAVLVVHEWWGHNDYARKRADMLASLGYTAMAVDMYGDGKQASHPEDAGKFAGAVQKNMPVAEERFNAAMEILEKEPTVDAANVAAIGYCFGGGLLLELARRGLDVDAIVSFHGSLGTQNPAEKGAVQTRIAVFNGAADPWAKPEAVTAFKEEMDNAGVDYIFVDYPGALHAFTNPDADENAKKFGLPLGYDAEADKDSWEKMKAFLKESFAK
jgi:dienelactone hydrolase